MGLLRRLLFSCGLVLALPLFVGKLHGAGPVLIARTPWPCSPAVGAFLGLFVTVGFVASGGPPNLFGEDGTSVASAPGSR